MLQRAWNHDPQSLPFAPYIRTHALVSLVQKGLQYHELEQSFDKVLDFLSFISPPIFFFFFLSCLIILQEGNPTPYTPASYFFGPPLLDSSPVQQSGGPVEPPGAVTTDHFPASVSPTTSKLARDGALNGHLTTEISLPSGKKTRKGDRNSADVAATTTTTANNGEEISMEIDSNGILVSTTTTTATNNNKDESPAAARATSATAAAAPDVDGDGDVSMGATTTTTTTTTRSESQGQELAAPPPPPPPTLTTGHSVGVQITPTKAADLSPDTALLDVASADHVTRTLWRPRDPTVVVAAGDTFCSLWRLSSSSSPQPVPVPEKLVDGSADNTCVSAVAWDPTGQKLAVATYNDMRGSITMYDVQGNAVDLLPEVPRMITGLHWAENSSHLVVVASDSRVSELALWDDSLRPDEFPSPQVIDGSIYDLSWLGRNQAFACGDGSVYQCEIDSSIHITNTFSSEAPDNPTPTWTFIRCASLGPLSPPLAVAASSATASLWVPTHDMKRDNAHQGDITAIELRAPSQSPAILASCSTDDTAKIWHIDPESKRFECIHRLFMGPSIPALAGAFSPDGYALAAASKSKMYIWNAERGGAPLATWTVPGSLENTKEDPDRPINGQQQNGTAEPLPDRSLSWDTDGKKLAFGVGHQVGYIPSLSRRLIANCFFFFFFSRWRL